MHKQHEWWTNLQRAGCWSHAFLHNVAQTVWRQMAIVSPCTCLDLHLVVQRSAEHQVSCSAGAHTTLHAMHACWVHAAAAACGHRRRRQARRGAGHCSNIVGMPAAMLLNEADATVSLCHSRTTLQVNSSCGFAAHV